jgi:guanine deaminase
MSTLLRARLFHTPKNPFRDLGALEAFEDGALALEGDTILAAGDYADVARRFPDAAVVHRPRAFLLPGFVDAHVHYPQIPVIGAMGLRLLEWLQTRTLPEEERFADTGYARQQARVFLRQLLRNGTTSALVFGAHFAGAVDAFFEEALASGLRITSGLVVSDRRLTAALHTTPERAHAESRELIARWHGRGRLRYAVTPRFSLSCSDALLEVCGALLQETPDVLFTSHLNEQLEEVSAVLKLFGDARDYLATYDRHGLVTERSVFAHNLHVYDRELARLGASSASVAHCPSSNMFLGSGLFPLRRHLQHGVHVALGSDVGGGTGFSLFKEGLMAYQGQMLHEDGFPLSSAHLLYLATRAGAKALGLSEQVGDFSPGKQADVLVLEPPEGSTLEVALRHSPSPEAALAALFTLAREDCVQEVYVGGERRFSQSPPPP